MLVFTVKDLPKDPVFPVDLEKLGYFLNDKDQIRKIADPAQDYQFKVSSNDRWNEVYREAMNTCIRRTVLSRLHDAGLSTLRLPVNASLKEQHVPVLVSPNLSTAKRVLVVFGEPIQDLGIWAYRTVGSESINQGSAVNFARAVLGHDHQTKSDTALILANTGQLIWHCGSGTAVSQRTWFALPRKFAVDYPMHMTQRNKIPRNNDYEEHVETIFEEVLAARGKMIADDAKIDIIGVAEGGRAAVNYLARHWGRWSQYISAMCLANPLHRRDFGFSSGTASSDIDSASNPSSFAAFLSARCRAYLLSDKPVEYCLPGALEYGCNCYASGEELNFECVITSAWPRMVEWLDRLYADPTYGEVELFVEDAINNGGWDEWRIQAEAAQDAEVPNSDDQSDLRVTEVA